MEGTGEKRGDWVGKEEGTREGRWTGEGRGDWGGEREDQAQSANVLKIPPT